MKPDETPDARRYASLRKLVASDAKQARLAFIALLGGPDTDIDAILDRATRAGEGRVRQMIATAARLNTGSAQRLEPWLRRWLELETDEFTRGAIEAALRPATAPSPATPASMPTHFVEAYRYAAERLCHRVRNPLTRSASLLLRLQRLAQASAGEGTSELVEIHAQFVSLFHRVGRVVEFAVDDAYLQWDTICLGHWLERSASMLSSQYGQGSISVRGEPQAKSACIRATGFLLDTIFGNLWANAVQSAEAAGEVCRVTADLRLGGACIDVLFSDCGPGFSAGQVETAFRQPFSTKAESRGRGLLEVADAVARLHGSVILVTVEDGSYRIRIQLPQEA